MNYVTIHTFDELFKSLRIIPYNKLDQSYTVGKTMFKINKKHMI